MSQTRAQAQTAHSGVEDIDLKATTLPANLHVHKKDFTAIADNSLIIHSLP